MARMSDIRHVLELGHDRRHRAAGRAVLGRIAGAQVVEKGLFAPGIGAGDVPMSGGASQPSTSPPARAIGALKLGPERIARRMAGRAMAKALDEIGAAIPSRLASDCGWKAPARWNSAFQTAISGRQPNGDAHFSGPIAARESRRCAIR